VTDIRETADGIFEAFLPPCTCQDLPEILLPVPSYVWVLAYRPVPALRWAELPVPLAEDGHLATLQVRGTHFEIQAEREAFLGLLPRLHAWAGMTVLQMLRPVPDTLWYPQIRGQPGHDAILRQNGWVLTFELPHDYETARVITVDRGHLAAVAERFRRG
jgi:hypothetical protein